MLVQAPAACLAALLAIALPGPAASGLDQEASLCDHLATRVWPTTTLAGSTMTTFVTVYNRLQEDVFLRDVRGQFVGAPKAYDLGAMFLLPLHTVNVTVFLDMPWDSGQATFRLTFTGAAASDTTETTCTASVAYTLFAEGIPSTGFEGINPGLICFTNVGLPLFVVGLILYAVSRSRRPGPDWGRPPTPLTRCPRCGEPLSPDLDAGRWRCTKCGWP